jgi:hypothetical protein
MEETIDILPVPNITKSVDELELLLRSLPQADCPLDHTFTDGLYVRTIFMKEDNVVVSKIHRTQHPFVISKGAAYVRVNKEEWQLLEAPYLGVTEPNTRRVLIILKDCIWTTFHRLVEGEQPENDSEEAKLIATDKIEERIIEKHELFINNHHEAQLH